MVVWRVSQKFFWKASIRIKWKNAKDKIINRTSKPCENTVQSDFASSLSFIKELSLFIMKELNDFHQDYQTPKSLEDSHKKKILVKTEKIKKLQIKEINDNNNDKDPQLKNCKENKSISSSHPKIVQKNKFDREEIAFNIKKKDALGILMPFEKYFQIKVNVNKMPLLVILKVRDENILKTRAGGEYLVDNYFKKVQDLGNKEYSNRVVQIMLAIAVQGNFLTRGFCL